MHKFVFPLAIGLALSFSGPAIAGEALGAALGGCGGSLTKSAKAPQQTVMQTPAPEKPVAPAVVKKPTKG